MEYLINALRILFYFVYNALLIFLLILNSKQNLNTRKELKKKTIKKDCNKYLSKKKKLPLGW